MHILHLSFLLCCLIFSLSYSYSPLQENGTFLLMIYFVDVHKSTENVDLFIFTEEIFKRKLHFCAVQVTSIDSP